MILDYTYKLINLAAKTTIYVYIAYKQQVYNHQLVVIVIF